MRVGEREKWEKEEWYLRWQVAAYSGVGVGVGVGDLHRESEKRGRMSKMREKEISVLYLCVGVQLKK